MIINKLKALFNYLLLRFIVLVSIPLVLINLICAFFMVVNEWSENIIRTHKGR